MADDFDFQFHRLLHGDLPTDHCLEIGYLPSDIWNGWPYLMVNLSCKDAQKIRFHSMHGMSGTSARMVLKTIEDGDYYVSRRGGERQIEVVYHTPNRVEEVHFAVISIDSGRTGIFLRTFYRSTNMSRSKFKGGRRLRWASGVDYFVGVT